MWHLRPMLPWLCALAVAPLFSGASPPAGPCDAAGAVAIHAIQGSGAASPMVGETVLAEGVVTGDFEGADGLDGFFLQGLEPDADPSTSEGIFVHQAGREEVRVGDRVRIRGRVREVLGRTELAALEPVVRCGEAALPAPLALDPTAIPELLERFEGMRVELGPATVTDLYGWGREGKLITSLEGRLVARTNGTGGAAARPGYVLDDGSLGEPPTPLPYRLAGRPPRVGDSVAPVIGLLDRDARGFVVQPVGEVTIAAENPRPAPPPRADGAIRVAAFNVLNYFVTLGQRGASSAAELSLQQAKIVAALAALDADVLALVEIENDGGAALDRLVGALAAASAAPWRAVPVPVGGQGGDAIRVALAYREDRVRTTGVPLVAPDAVYADRPPLAQTFAVAFAGAEARLTVVVAHLKSKGGCDDAAGPDRDQGDGQGCWNDLRTRQAHALRDFVATLEEPAGEPVLLLGDLNSYGAEDPIAALRARGLEDVLATHLDTSRRYSYVYRGQAGLLDHAFATPGLAPAVVGATVWHINADEAPALDYRQGPALGFDRPDPFRSSDHDPVVVDLRGGW